MKSEAFNLAALLDQVAYCWRVRFRYQIATLILFLLGGTSNALALISVDGPGMNGQENNDGAYTVTAKRQVGTCSYSNCTVTITIKLYESTNGGSWQLLDEITSQESVINNNPS